MDVFDQSDEVNAIEPQKRIKQLINYVNNVEVTSSVRPTRYYRSGLEMIRMARVYHEEGNLQHAYILYLRFMTLFVEKLRKHPEYASVPQDTKAVIQAKLREVFPIAEKLKEELLKQYTKDYETYWAAVREKEKRLRERKAKETRPKIPAKPKSNVNFVDVKTPTDLDTINFPDPNLPSAPSFDSLPKEPESSTIVPPQIEDCPVQIESGPVIPTIDRSTKPPDAPQTIYDKNVLRTVIVPTKVLNLFLNMSSSNTKKNVETCGILAGKLEQNELIITHMILPKQKGSPDSCITLNEEEIFDYQDHHNLITIGWIHTHPTQTAFLSSVDLHTHCSYQLLMPEAIAIVCAPKYNNVGYFILTPDYGLKFIANCKQTGFHPHPMDPPLFMIAEHIKKDSTASLDVLDLRIDNS